MKLFSPATHGVLDYATAGAMIAMPRMLGFSKQTTNLMTGAGAAVLGMSMLTRYPMGVLPVLPMPAHLAADAALDAVLIREGNKLAKREPKARTALMGMAIMGAMVSLLTRRR